MVCLFWHETEMATLKTTARQQNIVYLQSLLNIWRSKCFDWLKTAYINDWWKYLRINSNQNNFILEFQNEIMCFQSWNYILIKYYISYFSHYHLLKSMVDL